MSSHEKPGGGATNDWLTPTWLLDALGPFDLDPCASESCPTRVAPKAYTWREDGLAQRWEGMVFVNPPYGPHVGKWLAKLHLHGNGIALVFARTETEWAQPMMRWASGVLFIEGRLSFGRPGSARTKGNAGAPSMLLAFGAAAAQRLQRADRIPGVWMLPTVRS